MTAITAVTVQNTKGVDGYEAMSGRSSSASRSARWRPTSASTPRRPGMLANAEIVEAVADAVAANCASRTWSSTRCSSPSTATRCCARRRGRRAPIAAPAARGARHAEPPGGGRPRRVSTSSTRRTTCGAPPTRSWRSAPRAVLVKGGHLEASTEAADLFVSGGGRGMARRGADRHAEHARHRVHAVRGDRGVSGDGAGRWRTRCERGRRSSRRRSVTRSRSARGSGRWISCGRCRRPDRRMSGRRLRRSACGMRVTLPALMHDVQTCRRRGVPSTSARGPLDVRVPAPVVPLVRERHRLAEERLLPADVTYRSHSPTRLPEPALVQDAAATFASPALRSRR